MNSPRFFNKITATENLVVKESQDKKKLEAEALWLSSSKVIPAVSEFVPNCAMVNGALAMERIRHKTLAELYVSSREANDAWIENAFSVLKSFKEVLVKKDKEKYHAIPEFLYVYKTNERLWYLDKYKDEIEDKVFIYNGYQFKVNVGEMLAYINKRAKDLVDSFRGPDFMHGDFCFSNIFENMKLIDPRGLIGKNFTSLGDIRYDIAKLRHSAVGLYDFVKSNLFTLRHSDRLELFIEDPKRYNHFCNLFDKKVRDMGYDVDEIKFIEALLFLTMIPMHKDKANHQAAFFIIGSYKMICSMKEYKAKHKEEFDAVVETVEKESLRICFDLDGVICQLKGEGQSYADCKPNHDTISLMNDLHSEGHTIIIHTARGMQSSEHNGGAAMKSVGKITLDWLEKYEVPYDEIYFGKPNAHITIDDRCVRFEDGVELSVEDVVCKARLK